MQQLFAVYKKTVRYIIGLMSGTSCDGIDAALVKINGSGVRTKTKLVCHSYTPYPSALRNRLISASDSKSNDICRMNFELGDLLAKTAISCAEKAGKKLTDIDAIASHGQTICHIPPEQNRRGSTLQIGESSIIAQKTGLPVVSDFRVADMAKNGHGAPLVPYADYLLFNKKGRVLALQNIGGIANVTVVTPDIENVIAFDTGPGNCLINEAMNIFFKKPYDKNGHIAKSGKVENGLLKTLLSSPYFSKKPPKSTGRELFSRELVQGIISKKKLRPEDLIATLTHFTARSIKKAYDKFILNKYALNEIILSGGGSKNIYLADLLTELFRPITIKPVDFYGIPSGAKEALCFAILANETLSGNPSNLPKVTGASKSVVLGKITLP
jgi:anhydro-N-acetylmuramic acid kinase